MAKHYIESGERREIVGIIKKYLEFIHRKYKTRRQCQVKKERTYYILEPTSISSSNYFSVLGQMF